MNKGTTPTHTFNITIDTSLIKEIKITYSQNGEEVLVKRTQDCTIEKNKIITHLSQEDTFLFNSDDAVSIQVRILTTANEALTSQIMKIKAEVCLDKEVLV